MRQPSATLKISTLPALDDSKKQIRLLRVKKEFSASVPSCEIATFKITDPPRYIALSYMWDQDTVPKVTIMLNGSPHEAGRTVRDFLTCYQKTDEDTSNEFYQKYAKDPQCGCGLTRSVSISQTPMKRTNRLQSCRRYIRRHILSYPG